MTRSDASWCDVTTLPDGRVAWVYLRGTTVVCEDAETGAVLWSANVGRQLLYLRAAADAQGRACAVGVGQDDRAAAVFEGHDAAIDLGPAHGNYAVEIDGWPNGWRVYVQRSPTTYSVITLTETGAIARDETRTMPATSQGFLDIRPPLLITSDAGRHMHGLVLPNVTGWGVDGGGDGVWVGQLGDPNGLAVYDEETEQRSTLFIGDTQPPHIAQDSRGAFYICAWRPSGAWVERYTRPFDPDPEEDMQKPGVQITKFDPVIRPGALWRVEFHDRNNPDALSRCVVEFVDGSVHVSIENEVGADRSGTHRPVEVRCV